MIPILISHWAQITLGLMLLITGALVAGWRCRRAQQILKRQLAAKQQSSKHQLEHTEAVRIRQLTQSLSARNQMLARISHDLRSPLGHIISRTEALNEHNVHQQRDHIIRTARRQLELLDELIAYARDELQQQELALAPQYLYAFINELEEEGRLLAQHNDNRFELMAGDQLPVLVQADFQKLRRVIINLLENAAKFTHQGQIRLCLQSEDLPHNRVALKVAVADTGPGLSEQLQQRLEQPYQRGEHKKPGYGLGLAIVSELLQQMNSRLHTEQPDTGGSRFQFELTLDKAREYDVDQVFVENRVKELDGSGFRVLLVDDIALTCAYLSELLGGYGFDTFTAFSAQEALHHLAHEPVDLVITDQLMPDMNGWELLAQLRQHHAQLPVLLYSALPPQPDSQQAHLTFDHTLLKPAGSDTFLQCVLRLCTQGRYSALQQQN